MLGYYLYLLTILGIWTYVILRYVMNDIWIYGKIISYMHVSWDTRYILDLIFVKFVYSIKWVICTIFDDFCIHICRFCDWVGVYMHVHFLAYFCECWCMSLQNWVLSKACLWLNYNIWWFFQACAWFCIIYIISYDICVIDCACECLCPITHCVIYLFMMCCVGRA